MLLSTGRRARAASSTMSLRPPLRPARHPALLPAPAATRPCRSLFSLAAAPAPQHLAAARTLPHARDALYDLIADVDSYHRFVPYCARSCVTRWSAPDAATGRRWPAQADLHVGWGAFADAFTSRLRCVPGVSVEARNKPSGSIFETLVTRWSLAPAPAHRLDQPATEVHLSITYQFSSPVYAAVSAAVSDKVAAVIIEAFEKQARLKLSEP